MKKAFSLVELSIVLVILGLLIGGILAGKSLIHAAEVRGISADFSRYTTAVYAFRDKYFYLPGDMPNAESFWGTLDPANNTCRDTAATGTSTCNGDGDGFISGTAISRSYEKFRFWQHLVNAGLVEGQYSGTPDTSMPNQYYVTALNAPASKLPGGRYGVMPTSFLSGNFANIYMPPTAHYIFLAPSNLTAVCSSCSTLTPEDAWNIDTKLDDGMPASGRVTANSQSTCTVTSGSSITYLLTSSTVGCALYRGF